MVYRIFVFLSCLYFFCSPCLVLSCLILSYLTSSHYIFLHLITSYFFYFLLFLGHCERKALQNSFSAWFTWREILQLHRAKIHCKISNRAGREERVSSNSDIKCDSDDTTESQYKDLKVLKHLKDLKSERKIIPSVFISSSPRPIVAVYYLR